jgi:internalin A
MTEQAKPASRPWRQFLRFSVRGMIVVVLLTGGWLGSIVRSARIQREAVQTVEGERGLVHYDGEYFDWNASSSGWHRVRQEDTRAMRWLVDLIGIDYFHRVSTVVLAKRTAGRELSAVGRLTSLESLDVLDSAIEDADLANLKRLTKLTSLELTRSQITDAGLVHVRDLSELSKIGLRETRVTDAGIRHLKSLGKLTELDLSGTQITDDGLTHLAALANLTELHLTNTQVSDAGLAQLKGLTKLTTLYVEGTQVSKAGIKHLRQALPSLSLTISR